MTVQELYDHLLKNMTAEQALMKLLEGTVMTYDKLRFNEGEEIHPTIVMAAAALEMGWDIAIPNTGDDSEEIIGMAAGTEKYLNDLLGTDDCNKCDGNCSCDKEG